MIGFYNWLICKLFKRCRIYNETPAEQFNRYCKDNPSAVECRVYDI
jgi:hypothetical protein